MCGICGIQSDTFHNIDQVVKKMNESLIHRGPNDGGQYSDAMCSIAMRRLSIIDLSTGHQPISNESKSLHIVFNGEIYNYRELRAQLLQIGRHEFKTTSDTEVILHLYEEYGENVVEHLEGMFAFCIYDSENSSLFLARDRFGEKPLYYSIIDDTFAFSSEIGSLLECPAISRNINIQALYYYLHLGSAPSPSTLFKSIKELQPGQWMRWQKGKLSIKSYYHHNTRHDDYIVDELEAKKLVKEAILKAVKKQMVSDVPIGAFLSGGIDSSCIAAAMQRQSSSPINTFTVRFEHAPYDESKIARKVAEYLGTNHHEFVISNGGFSSDDLWRIIKHVGQPFTDSSAIPTYFISRYVRDHVTVCLSGDGGDEMFAGYNYFRQVRSVDRLSSLCPSALLSVFNKVFDKASESSILSDFSALRLLKKAVNAAQMGDVERMWRMAPIFSMEELDDLMSHTIVKEWESQDDIDLDNDYKDTKVSRLRHLMDHRIRYSLATDMLIKVDRMSMAASLEVRAPMLDIEVASISTKLSDDLLIKKGVTKYILREAVKEWLPDEVFSHPKTGFSIPLHMFQNKEYVDICNDLILNKSGILSNIFSRQSLLKIVERGLGRKTNKADISVYGASHQVWSLLQLAAWTNHFRVTV